MRENDDQAQSGMCSYGSLEALVPADHPLCAFRKFADQCSRRWHRNGTAFTQPSVRGEPMRMEQLDYNLLFRWFTAREIDDEVGNRAGLSKNRDRLLSQDVAPSFLRGSRRR